MEIKNNLLKQLELAQIGYRDAIEAIPYMPKESKPYTIQTANRYYAEIERIKRLLSQIKG